MAKKSKGRSKGVPWLVVGLAAAALLLLAGGSASAAEQGPPPPPEPPPPPPAPTPAPVTPTTTDIVWSTSGGKMHTKDAQGMLKGLGPAASDSRMTNLVVDGIWGPLSEAAMRDFQGIKGIPTTGQVGPDDADTLFATWQAAGSP